MELTDRFMPAAEKSRTSDLNKVDCEALEDEDSEGKENSRGSREKYYFIISNLYIWVKHHSDQNASI